VYTVVCEGDAISSYIWHKVYFYVENVEK
jgi:hypothetical protein